MMRRSSKFGLGVMLGALGGAITGLFLAPKAGKELRKDAQKLYEDISTNPEEAVKAIFGKVTDESMHLYTTAQKEVTAQLANLSENYKNLDTAKYKEVVKQAVDNVKADKKLPEEQLHKLMAYLEKDVKKLTASGKNKSPVKRKKTMSAKPTVKKKTPLSTSRTKT